MARLTKKDYNHLAKLIREWHNDDVLAPLVAWLKTTNPLFDADKFRDACRKEKQDV